MEIEIPRDSLRSVALCANCVVAHGSQKPEAFGKPILCSVPSSPIRCWDSPLMSIMAGRTGKVPDISLLAVCSKYGRIPCSPLLESHDIGY